MKKRKYLPMIITVLAVIAVGVSFAWLFAKDTVTNQFKTEQGKIHIIPEEPGFENDKDWDGNAKVKPVKVTNVAEKSNVDVLIRVNLTPRWVEADGVTPFAGDVSLIELVYDQFTTDDWTANQKLWVYGNDGYYYYKAKVSPGESTTALLKKVKKSEGKTIPEEYKGKDFIVDVNAEAVVADKDSFEKIWNITDKTSDVYKLLKNIVN